jgi:hypothetical protein
MDKDRLSREAEVTDAALAIGENIEVVTITPSRC